MLNIYNKYGFDHFKFEEYEVTIMKYSNCLCRVNDIDVIYVNNEFMKLSENTQSFILYHELGHIQYGHNKVDFEENEKMNRKRKWFSKLGLVVKEEIQADLYAVKRLGKEKALEAITDTIELLNTKELKVRKLIIKIFAK